MNREEKQEWLNNLEQVPYGETDTEALYDEKTGYYYNFSGDQLRDPIEYDQHSEGYTPFGDE
jgi:hypothetical protein